MNFQEVFTGEAELYDPITKKWIKAYGGDGRDITQLRDLLGDDAVKTMLLDSGVMGPPETSGVIPSPDGKGYVSL